MAREPEMEFVGGFYYDIIRGNQSQSIFRDEKDFLKYIEFLSDYKERPIRFLEGR